MILDDIVAKKKEQIKIQKKLKPISELIYTFKNESRDFPAAINKDEISIIAEIKKASPSKGIIAADFNHKKIAESYEKIGIDAVSVLTERYFFQGENEYIDDVKNITTKPILRKDFIIDEYQIFESKALKADAVLFIVAILGNKIKKFYDLAKSLELYCIVEVHNETELNIALEADCAIIGINNRDLNNFNVDIKTTEKLISKINGNRLVVSESGIKTPEDIKYLRSLGVNAVLIGETFMRIIDDYNKLNDFIIKSKGEY
ncbi:indole-3-glycerol phosphate synthase TrpC [Aceticella autotrophica]|uniref:Indole-3-glycerol phosphate synthase n=1 Tax=Aceticella autotrophica TaxID=2755338 RepID=A0A975AXC3_9THEO|nr:indole-3-glycerol phosphate synthase TrpC [Aceticella autotrophica]QSZ28217.1 indole-3-glycerol phosphate synthase TrpC [Aceticella autotrophica]